MLGGRKRRATASHSSLISRWQTECGSTSLVADQHVSSDDPVGGYPRRIGKSMTNAGTRAVPKIPFPRYSGSWEGVARCGGDPAW
jgi:hypothetical protein